MNRRPVPVFKVIGPLFEKGQIWLMKDMHLLIRRVGKRLVEFTIFKGREEVRGKRISASRLESIQTLQDYLRARKAILKPATANEFA